MQGWNWAKFFRYTVDGWLMVALGFFLSWPYFESSPDMWYRNATGDFVVLIIPAYGAWRIMSTFVRWKTRTNSDTQEGYASATDIAVAVLVGMIFG